MVCRKQRRWSGGYGRDGVEETEEVIWSKWRRWKRYLREGEGGVLVEMEMVA